MKNCIVLLLLLFTTNLFAQEEVIEAKDKKDKSKSFDDYKATFSLNAGPSFPVADFGQKTYLNQKSGFAKTGIYYSADFKYKFWDETGLFAMAYYHYNPTDAQEMLRQILDSIPSSVHLKLTSYSWKCYGAGIGVFNSVDLDGPRFDLKAMLGFNISKYPDALYDYTKNSVPIVTLKENATAATGSVFFGFGFDLYFPIKENWSATGSFNYILHDDLYSSVEFRTTDGKLIDSQAYTQNVRTISLTLGMAYSF